jgi:protein-S-isoprenylcysteine O-methyltransferase Ste14
MSPELIANPTFGLFQPGEDVAHMATRCDQRPEPIDRRRLITQTVSWLLILVLCLFLPAGTWAWFRGWLFLVVLVAASVVLTLYVRWVNPDAIAARVNRHEGTKRWCIFLGVTAFLPTILAIPIVAALDDGRYHWSHVPWWICVLGYLLLIPGLVGPTWAASVNKFIEPTLRIQTDRGHKVIDTGPYALIRHPAYAFGILLFLGMPLALGSLWALIPAILMGLLLVLATFLEDQALREELTGYKEYTQRVRYRLIPRVW